MSGSSYLADQVADQLGDLPPVSKSIMEKNFFPDRSTPLKMPNGNFFWIPTVRADT